MKYVKLYCIKKTWNVPEGLNAALIRNETQLLFRICYMASQQVSRGFSPAARGKWVYILATWGIWKVGAKGLPQAWLVQRQPAAPSLFSSWEIRDPCLLPRSFSLYKPVNCSLKRDDERHTRRDLFSFCLYSLMVPLSLLSFRLSQCPLTMILLCYNLIISPFWLILDCKNVLLFLSDNVKFLTQGTM